SAEKAASHWNFLANWWAYRKVAPAREKGAIKSTNVPAGRQRLLRVVGLPQHLELDDPWPVVLSPVHLHAGIERGVGDRLEDALVRTIFAASRQVTAGLFLTVRFDLDPGIPLGGDEADDGAVRLSLGRERFLGQQESQANQNEGNEAGHGLSPSICNWVSA